jgi:succinate dehydrogenase/fumarate reductase flavoprotein subunit
MHLHFLSMSVLKNKMPNLSEFIYTLLDIGNSLNANTIIATMASDKTQATIEFQKITFIFSEEEKAKLLKRRSDGEKNKEKTCQPMSKLT